MEKKNEMFNLLMDEVKTRCVESKTLGFDEKRTNDLLDDYILSDKVKKEYDIYVFSPYVDMVYDDTQYYKRLVGDPGDWIDDEDSYIVFLKYIDRKGMKYGYKFTYEIKVVKFDNLGDILYHKTITFMMVNNTDANKHSIPIYTIDVDTEMELNVIRYNLAYCVVEQIRNINDSKNGGNKQ